MLSANSEVSNGPLRAEGAPFNEAHLAALGPEIPINIVPQSLPVPRAIRD